jgi:uncharacterized damage-inducible protein DinB
MKKYILRTVLFLIISSFSVVLQAQVNDSLQVQLSRKWINAKAYTLKMAELMPAENYDFKPTPDVMSFKEQLVHIADNMKWLSSAFLFSTGNSGKFDAATMDKAAAIKVLSDAYDQALSVHAIHVKQLDETVSFFAGPMTRRQILILMHDHQTHHIGQLIVYLRLKDIKPPAYVGW